MKSTAATESLAVGESIEEGKNLRNSKCDVLRKPLQLPVLSYSKQLYNSLSTQRNSIDRSTHADVKITRFEFETAPISNVVLITGTMKKSDPATKRNSALCYPLLLLLHSGYVQFDFTEAG